MEQSYIAVFNIMGVQMRMSLFMVLTVTGEIQLDLDLNGQPAT
jgi:hypothetical protein